MKTQKGITLIALIITIIIMLILVAVTINVTLNGGLFDKAKQAAEEMEISAEKDILSSAAFMAYNHETDTIDLEELKNSLEPSGWTVELENGQIICTSPTNRRYAINQNSENIEIAYLGKGVQEEVGENTEGVEIAIGQYKTSKITIAPIIKLTDDEASQIAGSALGIEANNLREFNEGYMKSQGAEISYDEFVAAVAEQTGNPNPSDRDVFAYIFEEMEFETVQQLADYVIDMGLTTFQPETIKLTINGEDKTDIYNKDGFEYAIEDGVEYTIELQVDEKIATKTVKIEEGKPYGWDTNKVAIRTEGENIIPIPKDFEVSESEKEDTIDEGLVIKNGQNEFVWIPVESPCTYTETAFGFLTTTDDKSKLQTDSYQNIQYYYGNTLGKMDSEDDFGKIFTFVKDQENIEKSIRIYGGFYVGRYETTYNSVAENGTVQGIGVEPNQNVLGANSHFKIENGELKKCRWWGLYKDQKDMYANNSNVGSLMITSKQWKEIMSYTEYGEVRRPTGTYSPQPALSGTSFMNQPDVFDVSKNIYDLAGNVKEFTMNQTIFGSNGCREVCGGNYDNAGKANECGPELVYMDMPTLGSRVALYIK